MNTTRPNIRSIFAGMFSVHSVVLAIITLMWCCRSDEKDPNPGPPKQPEEVGKAQVWVTTGDQSKLLAKETDISVTVITETSFPTITIDASQKTSGDRRFWRGVNGVISLPDQQENVDQSKACPAGRSL
ncbi:MAG: hypothetical protein WD824_11325 [Cyclobacteriaceae bacterium]